MATVVGFISEKGGVGKTTACYHIAYALAAFHNKRVLVIDADYQRGGITGRFFPELIEDFSRGQAPGITLFHKFQQLYSAAQQTTDITIRRWNGFGHNIDVIPADPRLATVSQDKLPSTKNIEGNNLSILKHLQILDMVLDPIKENYDYILIDSHPEVSDILRSIIYCSDYCVSPVKLDRMSSIGVATVIAEIDTVNRDVAMITQMLRMQNAYRPTGFAGAVGMMAREYSGDLKDTENTERARLRQAGPFFTEYVTEGDGIRQAAAQRIPVYHVVGSNASKQSLQFKDLTREFLRICP